MRCAAYGATWVISAFFLGGCASTGGVRQAKQNDPIIVVTVQSTPKKGADKQVPTKNAENEKPAKEAEIAGILGSLKSVDIGELDGVAGGVPGGVIGGVPGGGFGALGSGGIGLSGLGTGSGTFGHGGLGSIGTIGTRTGYGSGSGGFGIRGGSSGGDRVKVRLGNVIVAGPLMLDVVQRHIDDRRNDIQDCHDFERARSGNRWGTLNLRLHIDATGHVDDVHVIDSSLSSSDLESCIAHAVGSFEFPAPGANASVTVTLPISF